ncbi:c-type cytochrome [Pseudoroseicyclus tamaricis]|uniref:Cytochrome c n=1 Tax=Pseudoroseicyclus tamaricis TaxID=2705421 RepID=A0A6B2K413_9RHOB|nr:c-type cytochrome [Pseudoroseicyclus tamaricis]NDV01386.1 cytochrome c [Pseudoroseicyclus tamaricis]
MKTTYAMLALPALLAACMTEPASNPESEAVDGAAFYAENCAACHGPAAMGNGPLAEGLPVQPANLTTLASGNGGTFPRNEVMSYIDGYLRGGHYADVMPEFGAGDLGPQIIVENEDGTGTPVPAALLAVTDYLESLQR